MRGEETERVRDVIEQVVSSAAQVHSFASRERTRAQRGYVSRLFPFQKTVRDKEYKAFQIKLDRLEKLCRALQTERNELNERVEVLKEQVSGRAAGEDPALPATQPCPGPEAPKELNTASRSAPGGPLDAAPRPAKEKPAGSAGAAPGIESVD